MIEQIRDRLIRATRRGVGMPMAGTAYWLILAGLATWAEPTARNLALIAFIATGAVFPIGWFLTARLGGDLMAKVPPLTELGMCLNFVQFAYWPVLILVFRLAPEWALFTLLVLFSSHFLGYAWLYRSRGYAWIAVAGVVVPTALALVGLGASPVAVACSAVVIYLIGVVLVLAENRSLPSVRGLETAA